ncbi:hypothetical protein DL93DRAFT_99640 [Clavulina sp. PMI_390]|nr:hypothetical protein DL93DRAFT_99640 [Clavulina sp. PMI_390]
MQHFADSIRELEKQTSVHSKTVRRMKITIILVAAVWGSIISVTAAPVDVYPECRNVDLRWTGPTTCSDEACLAHRAWWFRCTSRLSPSGEITESGFVPFWI